MSEKIMQEMRSFLRRVEDFGKLSGGQLRDKYNCDPFEGYEWIAKQGRFLAAKIDRRRRVVPPPNPTPTP
jgi:hypothetical protein